MLPRCYTNLSKPCSHHFGQVRCQSLTSPRTARRSTVTQNDPEFDLPTAILRDQHQPSDAHGAGSRPPVPTQRENRGSPCSLCPETKALYHLSRRRAFALPSSPRLMPPTTRRTVPLSGSSESQREKMVTADPQIRCPVFCAHFIQGIVTRYRLCSHWVFNTPSVIIACGPRDITEAQPSMQH